MNNYSMIFLIPPPPLPKIDRRKGPRHWSVRVAIRDGILQRWKQPAASLNHSKAIRRAFRDRERDLTQFMRRLRPPKSIRDTEPKRSIKWYRSEFLWSETPLTCDLTPYQWETLRRYVAEPTAPQMPGDSTYEDLVVSFPHENECELHGWRVIRHQPWQPLGRIYGAASIPGGPSRTKQEVVTFRVVNGSAVDSEHPVLVTVVIAEKKKHF